MLELVIKAPFCKSVPVTKRKFSILTAIIWAGTLGTKPWDRNLLERNSITKSVINDKTADDRCVEQFLVPVDLWFIVAHNVVMLCETRLMVHLWCNSGTDMSFAYLFLIWRKFIYWISSYSNTWIACRSCSQNWPWSRDLWIRRESMHWLAQRTQHNELSTEVCCDRSGSRNTQAITCATASPTGTHSEELFG